MIELPVGSLSKLNNILNCAFSFKGDYTLSSNTAVFMWVTYKISGQNEKGQVKREYTSERSIESQQKLKEQVAIGNTNLWHIRESHQWPLDDCYVGYTHNLIEG